MVRNMIIGGGVLILAIVLAIIFQYPSMKKILTSITVKGSYYQKVPSAISSGLPYSKTIVIT